MQASKLSFKKRYAVKIEDTLRDVRVMCVTSSKTRQGADGSRTRSLVTVQWSEDGEAQSANVDPQQILGEASEYRELMEEKRRRDEARKTQALALTWRRESLARTLRERCGIPDPQMEKTRLGFQRPARSPIQASHSGVQIGDDAIGAMLDMLKRSQE
jgi:hypothetical protein